MDFETFFRTGSDPKDVSLEHSIARVIQHLGKSFRVKVFGGHVTVSGIVSDYETKRHVAEEIRKVGGVRRVTNNIRVSQD
jgi:hypothetical protein